MSNSYLVSHTRLSPNNSGARTHKIDTVSVHCVVGQCSVETLGSLFAQSSRQASSNYGIGYDGRVGLYVDEGKRSWCTSSKANDQRAVTIEVASDTYHPYKVRDAAYKTLIELLADICRRNRGLGGGLRWQGNKSLIGQTDKQNMTVHRWFANKACVPVDTEVLTRVGWVKLRDIEIGDEIACASLDGLHISFEEVMDKVEERKQDTYTSNGLTATKDHRMVYSTQGSKTTYRIDHYKNLLAKTQNLYIPMAGYANADGLPLTDSMLKFLVAVQADGHYMYERKRDGCKSFYGVEFHLRKERKIIRLRECLEACHFSYNETSQANGTTKIRIYNKDGVNIVSDICEKWLKDKCFTWEWLNLSPEQAKIVLDEILLWDGCSAANLYTSKKEINLDVISALAAINGVGSNVTGSNIQFRQSPYMTLGEEKRNNHGAKTIVSCVTVKTGIFLCRQEGKTFIIGNCPGDYLYNLHGQIASEVNALLAKNYAYLNCEGDYVKHWQELLIAKGYSCGAAGADGDFGNGTLAAVKKFQTDNGLEADGVIGDDTIKALTGTDEPEKPEAPEMPDEPEKPEAETKIVKLKDADVFSAPPVLTGVTGAFTVVEESGGYGKLKSGAGWVKLPS